MIIAISGPAGSGKDTIANFFTQDYGFTKVSFAAPLYEEVAESFGVEVSLLNNRDTKETPLPELALCNCDDNFFKNVMSSLYRDPSLISLDDFEELPRSPRFILQNWGTQYRRDKFGENYWVDIASKKIDELKNVVISDLRFDNEDSFLRSRNAAIIHVNAGDRITKVISHDSEKGIPLVVGDYLVDNSKDTEFLERQVIDIIQSLGLTLV